MRRVTARIVTDRNCSYCAPRNVISPCPTGCTCKSLSLKLVTISLRSLSVSYYIACQDGDSTAHSIARFNLTDFVPLPWIPHLENTRADFGGTSSRISNHRPARYCSGYSSVGSNCICPCQRDGRSSHAISKGCPLPNYSLCALNR